MRLLAIDIGSSSVKAVILDGRRARRSVRFPFTTIYDGVRAEVSLATIQHAVISAIRELETDAKQVDAIVPATMSPGWIALDARGQALTPVVTHQDRRAVEFAKTIESRVGRHRFLALAGNRPYPGGISSTTCAWHLHHEPGAMRRAVTVGHLGTWLAVALTGERVIDLSNAGFTGLMDVRSCEWSDELIGATGVKRTLLPRIVPSNEVVGKVKASAAGRWGLRAGTPLIAGCVDGSAAMLAAGAAVGQLVNVCGSTDVLALCTDKPHPTAETLTRPLGVDGKWLSVSTIAAAGSAIDWVRQTFFREMKPDAFYALVRRTKLDVPTEVRFDATLAGSRTSVDSLTACLDGLTLATQREVILASLLIDLASRSVERLEHFSSLGVDVSEEIVVTGGGGPLMARIMRRNWPDGFRFRTLDDATTRGLAALVDRA